MYYNAAWSQIGMAALGGMAGHGVRYVALNAGCRLEIATFLGGLAVGVVASFIVRAYKVPFAVIAFAGAVTMMPGVQMYLALSGVLQLAQPDTEAKQAVVASTLGNAAQASLVIGALALGLVIADRMILSLGKPRN
jgi:uncharacterized membrane protein YjjB (DUF3815 family)